MTRSFLTVALLLALAMGASAAEPGASLDAAFHGPFRFRVTGDTVLDATLTLPDGPGPFPLVVIMHGGGGVGELDTRDVADLVPRGYAVAVIDSFSGRGFRPDTGTGAGASLRPSVRVPDAFAALQVLITHPKIDGGRALLYGRSHGGAATMIAATRWARDKYGGPHASFKAFMAVYPVCSVSYPEFEALTGPLRLHAGAKDELTPARACDTIVARLREARQDASLVTYEDAHHAFDASWPVSYFSQWLNYGSCALQLPSVDAPLPAEQVRQCVRRGTSMGGHPQAAQRFRENRAAELAILLR